MKRLKLSTFTFQPESWNRDWTFKYRLRKPLESDEVLVHTKATGNDIPRCWRKKDEQWQWAYIPYKAVIEPTLRWEVSTDIGAGLVLDADGIKGAEGRYLAFQANSNKSYILVRNGAGDGCYSHSLYLIDGAEKFRSLVSFGHEEVTRFTVKPQGATIRGGEKFTNGNESHYPDIVGHLPEGDYVVMTGRHSGRLRVCKMKLKYP
jgi:hypothetical protein